jgi:phosphoglycolate phosphatase
MQTPPRGCAVFDLDGVLVDSRLMYVRAIQLAMTEAGIAASDEDILGGITSDVAEWARAMKRRFGDASLRAIMGRAVDFVTQEGWRLVEPGAGAAQVLDACRGRRLKLALVTNAPLAYVGKVFDRFDLKGVFDLTVSCTERRIPKHLALELVLKETGTAPQDAVYVCDTHLDVVHARRAGVRAVVVFTEISWDFPYRERVERENPAFIAASMEDVNAWLMSHYSAIG